LGIAASLEKGSEHPLAAAIVSAAHEKLTGPLPDAGGFESLTGLGVKANVGKLLVAFGNQKLMDEEQVDASPMKAVAEKLRIGGQTVMYLAVGGKLVGILGVADPIKPSTKEAIQLLKE
jgi:Cu+-exporting ATPase